MIQDQTNITRLMFDLRHNSPPREWQAIYNALIEDRYSEGEWPRHKNAENVGQLRALGHAGLSQLCPALDNASINWLFGLLTVKRKPGRPRKIAA